MGMKLARISSIQRETGMVSVTFPDQEESTTDYAPFFAFGGEYHPPKIDDMVLVAELERSPCDCVVLGGFWNKAKRPPDPDAAWRKELDEEANMSVRDGVMTICARDIIFDTGDKKISLAELTGGE